LALCPYIIDLQVLDILEFIHFGVEVLYLRKIFLFFKLKLRHDSDSLVAVLVQFALEHLVFGLVLVEDSRYLLVLTQKLIILSKDKLDFIFELIKLFALCLKESVLFFQDYIVSF
jgi:hypothetical protein